MSIPDTDPRGPTYSEQHRHRCEVRQVLLWRIERGSAWARKWISGGIGSDGKPVRGVRQVRGDKAAERLMADCVQQWDLGNRGEPGDWRQPEAAAA